MATSPVKEFLRTHFMSEKCYNEFFVNLHFMHVPCLTIVLSKTVGFWIILDTLMAQLPQVLKIMRRGSAAGLSLTAVLLQLYAISCPVVYCMANNFPRFAWAERLFTLVQTVVIGFLILHYRGDTLKGLMFLLAYSGIMFLLGSYATAAVVSTMQASSVAALVASKVIQAGTNYSNGSTGQLSSISVFLVWASSLALIFVSLQDTGRSLNTLAHILSACLSCILLGQLFCYRKSSSAGKQKSE
uniref:mannose-P-dolichol utilization defect 1 protein-like n=1 Tax=Centroberyx gerrardi TaxID=166262 RepID=UPI003AAEF91C